MRAHDDPEILLGLKQKFQWWVMMEAHIGEQVEVHDLYITKKGCVGREG